MTLINRIGRLFKADLHGILDCLEDPHAVLKQAIREMEEEIERAEKELADLKTREKETSKQREERSNALTELGKEIELCLKASDETLAKVAIRRRLETERKLAEVDRQAERSGTARRELEQRIAAQREKVVEIKEKAESFAAESARASESRGTAEGIVCSVRGVTEEEVEIALLREKERVGAQL